MAICSRHVTTRTSGLTNLLANSESVRAQVGPLRHKFSVTATNIGLRAHHRVRLRIAQKCIVFDFCSSIRHLLSLQGKLSILHRGHLWLNCLRLLGHEIN